MNDHEQLHLLILTYLHHGRMCQMHASIMQTARRVPCRWAKNPQEVLAHTRPMVGSDSYGHGRFSETKLHFPRGSTRVLIEGAESQPAAGQETIRGSNYARNV